MLTVCPATEIPLDDIAALQARQLLDEILQDKITGVLALVAYRDGRVRCVRIGQTPHPTIAGFE